MQPYDFCQIPDRTLIHVHGKDALAFLNNLLTVQLEDKPVHYGALLTPQGKILTDMMVYRHREDGYVLEIAQAVAPDILKRLSMYKLRAQVTLEDISDQMGVFAVWGDTLPYTLPKDARLAELGVRGILFFDEADALFGKRTEVRDAHDRYEDHRIRLGIPLFLKDFQANDAFPHDVAMDQLNGVSFDKGCFVGQEVVSRMKHRGTARKRPVLIKTDSDLKAGSELLADGKPVGVVTSVSGSHGLSIARLDRLAKAMQNNAPITVDEKPVQVVLPNWAQYRFPESSDDNA
jgi:folate-binding protein YgfZ